MARPVVRRLCVAAILLLMVLSMGGDQIRASGAPAAPQDGIWQLVAERPAGAQVRTDILGAYTLARFSKTAFDAHVGGAARNSDGAFVVSLPMPDGSFGRFLATSSSILSGRVAAQFPDIQTFRADGLDDPTATARFGWTELGFHAIVLSEHGTSYIDPNGPGDNQLHVIFRKADHWHQGDAVRCLVGTGIDASESLTPLRANNEFPISHGTSLRTYRLALAATAEYTTAAGGTTAQAMARMVATINRVNGVYERDLSVRLLLVTGSELIFTNAATDPYTNTSGSTMLAENQTYLDTTVGSAAYDIGHVFSTGGGGVATLRSVCVAGSKARGVTGLPNPTGDVFDIDYVAHEVGHQFGGSHTFNAGSGSCTTNRSATHAYEVGSGSTIQGYAGICSPENVQLNSDDYFHVESLDEMTAFLTSGSGSTCGTTAGANTPPTVSTPAAFTIPRQTPFALSASASDANGDSLTYTWEQFDLGAQTTSALSAGSDRGEGPLFRSRRPSTSPIRTFPAMQYVLQNGNVPPLTYACSGFTCISGEALPDTNRTMNFQVTVRDNRSAGGGIATASTAVTVNASAGPFVVTSPNTAVTASGGSTMAVTWNPNGTQSAPISAANVEITLSTDGGVTFSTVLLASTANDGSADVVLPNTSTSTARIRIGAVGNIFFDVSDANFSITPAPCTFSISPSSATVASTAGSSSVSLTASGGGCGWNAGGSSASWLSISPGYTSGTGGQTVFFQFTANTSTSSRSGTLEVAGRLLTVTQSGATATGCCDGNGDGRADIYWRNQSNGQLAMWFMNGVTLIDSLMMSPIQVADINWRIEAVMDIDADNDGDLIWRNGSTGDLAVWIMNGRTLVDSQSLVPGRVVDLNWRIAGSGDFNGDRKPDLLWRSEATGQLALWYMNGRTLLDSVYTSHYVADTNWRTVAVNDMDGDGDADLILRHSGNGEMAVWFMNGRTLFDSQYLSVRYVSDLNWKVVGSGDFNGDGRPDLLWQNDATGDLAAWFMNGRTLIDSVALSPGRVMDLNWKIVGPR